MRAIVADTAPLNYLVLIQAVDVLPQLYGRVLIPHAVKEELSHPNAPDAVRAWIVQPPPWLDLLSLTSPVDPAFSHLDAGECEAISLALEHRAVLLLMDDRDGAIAARSRGLTLIGTLGVLDIAAARGWIDLPTVFRRLNQTTFRSPARLMSAMLEEDARRKREV